MSRPSSYQPRPSVWAGSQNILKPDAEECSPHLFSCVEALGEACNLAHKAQTSLREGVSDLPRMSRVLDNQRLFVVVNESLVRQYASQLHEEVEPQVLELLRLAENGLKDLERVQMKLQTQTESSAPQIQHSASSTSKIEMRRYNLLVSQRERLSKDVAALEVEISRLESVAEQHESKR